MNDKCKLLMLCKMLADFDRVTHWAISKRVTGRGDFFKGIMGGISPRRPTYRKVVKEFSRIWPDDLGWPKGISRPLIEQKDAA